jgi:Glutamyl-tRNAGlu reductase, dimerisation domain
MRMSLTNSAVDHVPAAVHEPSSAFLQDEESIQRAPSGGPGVVVESCATIWAASSLHRHRAAALIRKLCGNTQTALRRELDRFFAARPDMSHADRAAIVRALSRYRNQLLHHSRSTLRAAAADPSGDGHDFLDAIHSLLQLQERPSFQGDTRRRN